MRVIRLAQAIGAVFFISGMLLWAGNETWPAWRGPSHDGIAKAKNLPANLEDGKHIQWRVALPGAAPSTPVIWKDRIYLSSAEGEEGLLIMAFDTQGKELWRKDVAGKNYAIRRGESNAVASSPVTDGKHIWFLFGTGTLLCVDTNGETQWQEDLFEKYPKFNMYHGYASSPLLRDGRLYLQMLHTDGQLVVALNAATGKEIWQHTRKTDAQVESLHSYASPVPFEKGSQPVLIVHGSDVVTGHDFTDGSEVWRCGGLQNPEKYNNYFRLVATPVVSDDLVVVPSAKNGPVWGLRPAGLTGDLQTQAKAQAWKLPDNTPDVPSPLVADGLVYLCRENGILICLDAKTGEMVYQERLHSGNHRASPVLADGKIYIPAGDGTLSVVKPGRKFEVLAKNPLGERIAASPAVANDTLYIRTFEALYAIASQP